MMIRVLGAAGFCIIASFRFYSITSSARSRSDGGIVRPRASAVLRLTTGSIVVGYAFAVPKLAGTGSA